MGIKLTKKQKELIARWIKEESGTPDYDGYLGQWCVPEDIMDVYKKLYPNDWD